VRKFTPLTERLGPQATVALLNDYFTRMVGCIEDESGLLDKYIGDAIMAVFGVPFAHEDDPDRAVRAGVAMMRALRAMNDERAARELSPLEIGIGIHSGDVFSGNIGSPRRMDFTVMGDGVNLASRLEGLTKQYAAEVLISDFTLRSLKSTFRTREVDRVIVVGRREPVSIHEVLDYHDDKSFPNLLDTLYAYRNGIEFYRQRRFKDAVADFEEALTHHPEDRLSEVYRDRCLALEADPPGEDWDGVWVARSK
jgi:adenylate cyclase